MRPSVGSISAACSNEPQNVLLYSAPQPDCLDVKDPWPKLCHFVCRCHGYVYTYRLYKDHGGSWAADVSRFIVFSFAGVRPSHKPRLLLHPVEITERRPTVTCAVLGEMAVQRRENEYFVWQQVWWERWCNWTLRTGKCPEMWTHRDIWRARLPLTAERAAVVSSHFYHLLYPRGFRHSKTFHRARSGARFIGHQLLSVILTISPEIMLREGKKMHFCRGLWLLTNLFII